MERDYLTLTYTEEDERGFRFTEMSETEMGEFLTKFRKKRSKLLLLLVSLLVPVVFFLPLGGAIGAYAIMYGVLVTFILSIT